MDAWSRNCSCTLVVTAAILAMAADARALDKQGAAHPGGEGISATGLQLSGQLFLGVLPYNPTYAARPDNSGRALLRAGGHADVNLIGQRLFVPLDLNVFSDRDASGALPSELDLIGGLASTWGVLGGAAEIGARGELDTSVDGRGVGGGSGQGYVDVRGRYIFSLGHWVPAIDAFFAGGDVAGWLTLGWFAWNPRYYARPDNSGRALFRYAAHAETSFWRRRLAVVVDGTFFTDGTRSPIRPSELDLTIGTSFAVGAWTAQVAYERDMPIDGHSVTGLVQHMLMIQTVWSFSWDGPRQNQSVQ